MTLTGRTLGNRYAVGRLLGEGGMGAVYEAKDTQLERSVALKVLTGHPSDKGNARFEREARSAARLNHRHIIRVIELATGTADEPPYIVMERVVGETLSARAQREGRLSVRRALDIISQAAGAVGAAHDAGIIHRDLKPANIFLVEQPDGSDFVKVLDFGLAREIGAGGLTSTGQVLGTVSHMSPEQALGHPLGPQCDVWALGVILYELLTGVLPFRANTPGEILAALMRGDVTPLAAHAPGLSPHLVSLVDRAMALAPEQRYPNARELYLAIERVRAAVVPEAMSSGPGLATTMHKPPGDTPAARDHAARFGPTASLDSRAPALGGAPAPITPKTGGRGALFAVALAVPFALGALGVLGVFVLNARARRDDAPVTVGSATPSAPSATPAPPHATTDEPTAPVTAPIRATATATADKKTTPPPRHAADAGAVDAVDAGLAAPPGPPARVSALRIGSTTGGSEGPAGTSDADSATTASARGAVSRCLPHLTALACDDGFFSVTFELQIAGTTGQIASARVPPTMCRVNGRTRVFAMDAFSACLLPAVRALRFQPSGGSGGPRTVRRSYQVHLN